MKKNWQGSVIVILSIVLLIMVCFIGYIVYERNNGTLAAWNTHKEEKEEIMSRNHSLDIHSKLVRSLYNKVKSHQDSCLSTWIFDQEEFDVSTSSEKLKMRIVSNNLSEGARIRINCNNGSHDPIVSKIPRKIGNDTSACEQNEIYGESFDEFGYKREYIDSLYQELFGSKQKLDTSVNIPLVASSFGSLIYVESLDMYIHYPIITGFTCAETDSFELVGAEKVGNEVKLSEKYIARNINDDGAIEEQELKYVYTFKLEEDGMYSFVSRKKVS